MDGAGRWLTGESMAPIRRCRRAAAGPRAATSVAAGRLFCFPLFSVAAITGSDISNSPEPGRSYAVRPQAARRGSSIELSFQLFLAAKGSRPALPQGGYLDECFFPRTRILASEGQRGSRCSVRKHRKRRMALRRHFKSSWLTGASGGKPCHRIGSATGMRRMSSP